MFPILWVSGMEEDSAEIWNVVQQLSLEPFSFQQTGANLVMKQVEEEVTKKYVKSEACKQREKEILVGSLSRRKQFLSP